MYEEAEVRVMEEVESCYTVVDLPLPKKKKRSKGSGEHTDKPKKPRSAYLLYYFDVHQSLQQENPDMPQSEINKRISDSWKRLNVADKGYYLERARMEKDGVDPSAQSTLSSQDVPGFRKILPRTNYVLLPKTSLDDERPGASVEVCMEDGVDSAGEEAPKASGQDGLVSPLTLGSEVELVEQCVGVGVGALGDDTAMSLGRSAAFQGLLPQCSTSARRLPAFVQDRHHGTTLLVKEEDARAVGEAYGGVGVAVEEGLEGRAVLPQVKADATHLVAIIPSHELLDNRALPTAVMLPVMNRVKPEPKPSFKLSIKYTRRGRGSCSTPGCSFTYVTRHKPPQCPDCGRHLGGKWVPPVAKGAPGSAPSPRKQQKGQDDEACSAATPSETAAQDTVLSFIADAGQEEAIENATEKAAVREKTQSVSSAGRGGAGSARTLKRARRKRDKMDAVTSLDQSETSQCTESTAVIGMSSGRVRLLGKDKNINSGQKRRIRAILPAPASPVFQWIAVPPNKTKRDPKVPTRTAKPSAERTLGLKPNTLKQLGHSVPPSALEQKPTAINSNQYIVTDSGVKILSMVPFKQSSSISLALGLSTARGRGRCKNPSCDYIYKNRHKPAFCPSCGYELSSKPVRSTKAEPSLEEEEAAGSPALLLDVAQGLSAAQREVQHQSTVVLLRRALHFPESETELQDVLRLIRRLNRHTQRREGRTEQGEEQQEQQEEEEEEEEEESLHDGWPSFYEPPATHCSLCHYPLYRGGEGCSVAGLQQCWLLTESLIQPVSLQLKICLNVHCLAVHSFIDIHPGLFNVGNQLLVSLDLFFKIRSQIRLGQEPSLSAFTILNNTHTPSGWTLSSDEEAHLQELLCSGYWAFECLTVRDYNDMICGVCGIAPKLEIAQRSTNTVLQLKNVEFTWPEFQTSEEVQVEEFWLAMEGEALEQAAFPSSVSITRFDASIIAPFFPPLMRSAVVMNSEKDKLTQETLHTGDASVLMRLIHDGHLRPEQMDQHSEEELCHVLEQCGTPSAPYSSKVELMMSVCLLYTQIQNGLSTGPRPPHNLTAGKLSKVCPHQVVCGSKYLVRGESARDHVDLLVSSRFWPPVYVTDCGQQVALCTEALYPELADQMWGRNQGCFSDPEMAPEYVSCSELQDQQYSVDLSAVDSNPRLHPITKSPSRWIACPSSPDDSCLPSCSTPHAHRTLTLCRELQPYASLVSDLTGGCSEEAEGPSWPPAPRSKPLVFDNPAHYYLYNRLVDFLRSRDVVSQQMAEVLGVCQQGEVVMIRDALYRLGVAQLNAEEEQEEARAGQEEGGAEGDADTVATDDAVVE